MRLHDFLDHHAQQSPDAEFAVCSGMTITFRQAQHQANRIAGALIGSGLSTGDRVALLQKNSIETVLLYHGALQAGIVPVPINYRLVPADWLAVCQDARPKLLVCDADFVPQIDAIRHHLNTVGSFIMTCGDSQPGWSEWEEWTSRYEPQPPNDRIAEDHAALLLYTSGTTGALKGAVLTHHGVTANIEQLRAVLELQPNDRFLFVLPHCHAAGIVAMLHVIACGACLVIQRGFDAHEVIDTLEHAGITVTMMVPTMIRKCLSDVPNVAKRSFPKLRLVIYGASPIQAETVRQMIEVFRCDLAQRYGTTETLSLTWLGPDDHRRAFEGKLELLRSAGRALPGTEVRIVDGDGQFLAAGDKGEIVVRGPQPMRGYWHAAAPTADEPQHDWVHTGDVGFIDSDGYVYICDRLNDVIISGGENIHPGEIENVLLRHPHVADVAVIGIPDLQWGERVKAIVVLRKGASCSSEQLMEHCRGRLAGFKVPDSIDFVPSLPRNPAGKILKRQLRDKYWRGHERRI